jgi:ribonuclease-3
LEQFAARCGLSPQSATLLTALTHSSYAAEHAVESNERLEFLGDAVVDLVAAEAIMNAHGDFTEGECSQVRAQVVDEATFATIAMDLNLGELMRLGKGEERSGGRQRVALLADAFEAVVAAIYLDRGLATAEEFVLPLLAAHIARAAEDPSGVDPKTRLSQWAESQGFAAPRYEAVAHGPVHATTFEVTVTVGDALRAEGRGSTKRAAESAAAAAAWRSRT